MALYNIKYFSETKNKKLNDKNKTDKLGSIERRELICIKKIHETLDGNGEMDKDLKKDYIK